MIHLPLTLIQLFLWPQLIQQPNKNYTVYYPNQQIKMSYYWHAEESNNLKDWYPILYDDSITNIPLLNAGQSTFIRLVGTPIQ